MFDSKYQAQAKQTEIYDSMGGNDPMVHYNLLKWLEVNTLPIILPPNYTFHILSDDDISDNDMFHNVYGKGGVPRKAWQTI